MHYIIEKTMMVIMMIIISLTRLQMITMALLLLTRWCHHEMDVLGDETH